MPPTLEPLYYRGLGKGILEVVPARFPGPQSQISRNESGVATETSISPAPVDILRAYLSPGMLTLGCWEESLPRMKGILTKKGSFLDTKVEPE